MKLTAMETEAAWGAASAVIGLVEQGALWANEPPETLRALRRASAKLEAEFVADLAAERSRDAKRQPSERPDEAPNGSSADDGLRFSYGLQAKDTWQ
jgi:hypothetical protein